MTDAWAPAAFVALGRFVAAPTLDLTIHIRRPLPPDGMAPEDFVLPLHQPPVGRPACGRRTVSCGRRAASCIAQSRQLALVAGAAA